MRILDAFSLRGKVAVITGGRGMYGHQAATALYEAGAKLYIASPSIDELKKTAEQMRSDGGDVTAHYVDLGDEASILALRDDVLADAGRVDVLVNNAVIRPMSSYSDPAALFHESMRVNATGTFIISRAFGDEMAKQGGGSIINIASMQGMIAPDATLYEGLDMNGFLPDYFFHKGGMIQYTRFLASQYGPMGVRCNVVSPGGLRSHRTNGEFEERYGKRTLLGRMAGPDDLKGVIVFLASDASAYITAANIPVDGGYVAK
ncbi:oxidoreductase [Clostridia bacterium]|nr:oxidoreductase [Clostridia bacterium]